LQVGPLIGAASFLCDDVIDLLAGFGGSLSQTVSAERFFPHYPSAKLAPLVVVSTLARASAADVMSLCVGLMVSAELALACETRASAVRAWSCRLIRHH